MKMSATPGAIFEQRKSESGVCYLPTRGQKVRKKTKLAKSFTSQAAHDAGADLWFL